MLMDLERSTIHKLHNLESWPKKHNTYSLNGWHVYHNNEVKNKDFLQELISIPYSNKKNLFFNWNTSLDLWASTLSLAAHKPIAVSFQLAKTLSTVFLVKEFRIINTENSTQFPNNITVLNYKEPDFLMFNLEEVYPDDFHHFHNLFMNTFHPSIMYRVQQEDHLGLVSSCKYLFKQYGSVSLFLKSIVEPLVFQHWPELFEDKRTRVLDQYGKLFQSICQITNVSKSRVFYHHMRQKLGMNMECFYKDLSNPNNPSWQKESYRVV